ncbi:MAG: dephospho-CoA kinase [Dehalococcoidia bacterium]|nr:MAG: dephospho-CoA kinase [Dehalococcoidia bacterium]
MKVIGLTGGIGSGKSTIARLLTKLGAKVIDTDKIGHEILNTDSEAVKGILASFGQQILNTDGSVNRKELGKIVFADGKALSRLNCIVHPLIYRLVKKKLLQYKKRGAAVVVIDAPLLIETNWVSMVDVVWVVIANEASIIKRLQKTGLSRDEAISRIRYQLNEDERVKQADVVIKNDYSLDELKLKVGELWQNINLTH